MAEIRTCWDATVRYDARADVDIVEVRSFTVKVTEKQVQAIDPDTGRLARGWFDYRRTKALTERGIYWSRDEAIKTLRDHYADKVDDLEKTLRHTREQLELLENWSPDV